MSHRYYFLKIEKLFIEKARKCLSEQGLHELCVSNNIKPEIYNWGNVVFEFGSSYEFSTDIESNSLPLFDSQDMQSMYCDYDPRICSEENFMSAIEFSKNKICSLYKNLNDENYNDIFALDTSHYGRMKRHIRDYYIWWNKLNVLNLDKNVDKITDSWLYEHDIFELVHQYKKFDWEKYDLIFMGW